MNDALEDINRDMERAGLLNAEELAKELRGLKQGMFSEMATQDDVVEWISGAFAGDSRKIAAITGYAMGYNTLLEQLAQQLESKNADSVDSDAGTGDSSADVGITKKLQAGNFYSTKDDEGYVMAALCIHELVDENREALQDEFPEAEGAFNMRSVSIALGTATELAYQILQDITDDDEGVSIKFGFDSFDFDFCAASLEWGRSDDGRDHLRWLVASVVYGRGSADDAIVRYAREFSEEMVRRAGDAKV